VRGAGWTGPSARSALPPPPRSWVNGGYDLADVDVREEKAKFVRSSDAGMPLILPPQLSGRVLDNVAFEFENFCHDLIQRYGL